MADSPTSGMSTQQEVHYAEMMKLEEEFIRQTEKHNSSLKKALDERDTLIKQSVADNKEMQGILTKNKKLRDENEAKQQKLQEVGSLMEEAHDRMQAKDEKIEQQQEQIKQLEQKLALAAARWHPKTHFDNAKDKTGRAAERAKKPVRARHPCSVGAAVSNMSTSTQTDKPGTGPSQDDRDHRIRTLRAMKEGGALVVEDDSVMRKILDTVPEEVIIQYMERSAEVQAWVDKTLKNKGRGEAWSVDSGQLVASIPERIAELKQSEFMNTVLKDEIQELQNKLSELEKRRDRVVQDKLTMWTYTFKSQLMQVSESEGSKGGATRALELYQEAMKAAKK